MSADNPWGISFMAMFHMANDSHLFANTPGPGRLPLVEAKMIHQFDHRFGTYAGQTEAGERQGKLPELDAAAHADPFLSAQPRYWVDAAEVAARLAGRWDRRWLLGWRDICRATDARTVIAAVIPRVGVGHKLPLMLPGTEPALVAALYANLSTFSLDYAARQKVGGTSLTYFILKQLPVLSPETYAEPTPWEPVSSLRDWILPRVLELTYTAWDLEPFARDCGWSGSPFRWDEDRRFLLRCELDAAFFHLYLGGGSDWGPADSPLLDAFPAPADAVAHIMESFPIVKSRDMQKHGHYRTKRVILDIYDRMQTAIATGEPYQTLPDPPPGDPRAAHLPKGQRRPAGEAYELNDLLKVNLAGETVPVRVINAAGEPEELPFRFLGPGDPLPDRNQVVIVRHPNLRQGDTTRPIAGGKLLWSHQQDMETGEPIVTITLRGFGPPASLRLPESEWADFRPLAVAETE